ncbi:AAA family ATPase [Wenzhouxiangella sp. AB-CW3]|uniref:AAA family ATPase n=1 Tax=Wenzhouxiangella sp. AB-CW3 TaxID=2771012 RepID=UPI00168AC015|nr:AAA family ATPase [Wenzhouxiangella sp. AB-CW3]QOC21728.1 AAA family ATPase [Wenzhouxiangella sp. AB-CW3]
MSRFLIPPEQLKQRAISHRIDFDSTRDLTPLSGAIGQDAARRALRFGLLFPGNGQHVYVCGRPGSRRRQMIDSVVRELKPEPRQSRDFCYVHNFSNPDRPRLIRLKSGQGRAFQQQMMRIGLFVRERLPEILGNDPIRSRCESRLSAAERDVRELLRPVEKQLKADGLGLLRSQSGANARIEIGVRMLGKPVSFEEFRDLVARKQVTEEERRDIQEKIEHHQPEMHRIARQIREIWHDAQRQIDQIKTSETARLLGEMTAEIARQFRADGVDLFLRDVIDDILEKRVGHDTGHLADPTVLYGVKILKTDSGEKTAPFIAPELISPGSLFGGVNPVWRSGERAVASFHGIHAGALIEADGGFVVLDAEDLIDQPVLLRRLVRSLRSEATEILAPVPEQSQSAQSLKPDPIPIDCGVILYGDADAYGKLASLDREFAQQFRVMARLRESIPNDEEGIEQVAALLATIIKEQSLLPLDRSAINAVIDHVLRRSGRADRLVPDESDLAFLLREATFLAGEAGRDQVGHTDIEQALEARRERASVAWFEALELLSSGTRALETRGRRVGQINITTTLATLDQRFALPVRIDIAIGSVSASPQAHWTGVDQNGDPFSRPVPALAETIAGFLHLDGNAPEVRLSQSGGPPPGSDDIEAAMAPLACALLATLAGVPVRQELLISAAVDLRGQLTPVRRITERVEAFYQACLADSLSGKQGVALARRNVDRLAPDQEIIKACTSNTFRLYGLDTLTQALELLTGQHPGTWQDGQFTEDSLLARARAQAMQSSQS